MTVRIVLQGKIVAALAPRVNLDQTVSTTVIVTTVIFDTLIIFHFHFQSSNTFLDFSQQVPNATQWMANVNASQVFSIMIIIIMGSYGH